MFGAALDIIKPLVKVFWKRIIWFAHDVSRRIRWAIGSRRCVMMKKAGPFHITRSDGHYSNAAPILRCEKIIRQTSQSFRACPAAAGLLHPPNNNYSYSPHIIYRRGETLMNYTAPSRWSIKGGSKYLIGRGRDLYSINGGKRLLFFFKCNAHLVIDLPIEWLNKTVARVLRQQQQKEECSVYGPPSFRLWKRNFFSVFL
jgi:hypothetical protein